MTTEEEYLTAKKALRHAVENPDAFSADELEDLTSIVESYKPEGGSAPTLVSETGPEIGPPTVAQMEAREKVKRGRKKAAEHPEIVRALEASGLPVGMPVEEAKKKRRSDFLHEVENNNLPSASKIQDLFAPPEYTPPQSLGVFGDPIGFGGMTKGSYDVHIEPSIGQFRSEARPVYGDKVDELDTTSQAYKAYADKKYQMAYDQAVKSGRGLIRPEYILNDKKREEMKIGLGLGGGLVSLADAATAGVASRTAPGDAKKVTALAEGAPDAVTLPAELTGAALNPLFRMFPAISKGTSFGKGVAKQALRGGAAAGGTTAIELAARKASGEDVSLEDAAEAIGKSAVLGVGLGATGGLITEGARLHGENLERTTPLGELRKRGAQTSVTKGIKAGPVLEAEERAAAEAGFVDPITREADVPAYHASRLEEPMTTAARREQGLAEQRAAEAKEAIYELPANQRKISAEPFVNKLREVRRSLVSAEGRALSPASERQVGLIDRFLSSAQERVPDLEAEAAGRWITPGMPEPEPKFKLVPRKYTPREVDKLIDDLQSYDPQAVKSGVSSERDPLHRYNELKKAAHEMRDQVRGGTVDVPEGLETEIVDKQGRKTTLRDYSAYEHGLAEDQAEAARRRVMAGLPEGEVPERLSGNQARQLRGATEKYGSGGESDAATEYYAERAGKKAELEPIRSARQLADLRKKAKVSYSPRLHMIGPVPIPILAGSMTGTGARLRLDPALRSLSGAKSLGRFAPAAASRLPGLRRPGEVDEMTIDEISAMLASMPPL